MALFLKKESADENCFDKDRIIQEILEENEFSEWLIFPYGSSRLFPDLLCIKSVSIQKEIIINKNPFSEYRRTSPAIYQIVIGAYIAEDIDNVEMGTGEYWKNIVANSAGLLFRKLDMEE